MSVPSLDPRLPPAAVWRSSWALIGAALVVGALSVWLFWDGLAQMWLWWTNSPEDSYEMLIVPVSSFLIWQQKDRLERVAFTGSWWGVVFILLGGLALVVGQLGTVFTIVQYAYVITLCGLVLSFLGWNAFRLIAIPMLMLLFAIPLPQFFLATLSLKLQLLSSQFGVAVMRLFDVTVFLEGNVIDLGGYKLQVAEACSGLRYLFPLMTMGFLMAYFYRGALWKRLVLFASSVPITVLMNSLRVGIIGITVERWGISMAEGFLHEFQGWVIFMISVALMFVEVAVLNSIGRESGTWRQLFSVEFPAPTPAGAAIRHRGIPTSFWGAAALLLGFITITFVLPRPTEVLPVRTEFIRFPMQIGNWRGVSQALEGVYLDELKLQDYVLANYTSAGAGSVNLYVAYYDSQRKGEAVHSPRSCLPGGGWQIKDFGQHRLAGVSIDGVPLTVNRALIQMGDDRQLVYYWFQQRGRVIDNEFAVKWYLFWDAFTRHRTDGAMVRLMTRLPPSTSEIEGDRRLTELTAQVAPILSRFVPD